MDRRAKKDLKLASVLWILAVGLLASCGDSRGSESASSTLSVKDSKTKVVAGSGVDTRAQAERLLKHALEVNDPNSLYGYYRLVIDNQPELEEMLGAAAKTLEMAAALDHREAQAELGAMLCTGTLFPKNIEFGMYWLHLASQHGHVVAQRRLGIQYLQLHYAAENSKQPDLDYLKNAMYWLRQSADSGGDAGAMYLVGQLLILDFETKDEGIKYLVRSAEYGNEQAVDLLKDIEREFPGATGMPETGVE
jgi:TPR repeat protein